MKDDDSVSESTEASSLNTTTPHVKESTEGFTETDLMNFLLYGVRLAVKQVVKNPPTSNKGSAAKKFKSL